MNSNFCLFPVGYIGEKPRTEKEEKKRKQEQQRRKEKLKKKTEKTRLTKEEGEIKKSAKVWEDNCFRWENLMFIL